MEQQPEKPCQACGVVLLLAIIIGCYIAGAGYSGWWALGIALNVYLVGWLGVMYLRDRGKNIP